MSHLMSWRSLRPACPLRLPRLAFFQSRPHAGRETAVRLGSVVLGRRLPEGVLPGAGRVGGRLVPAALPAPSVVPVLYRRLEVLVDLVVGVCPRQPRERFLGEYGRVGA